MNQNGQRANTLVEMALVLALLVIVFFAYVTVFQDSGRSAINADNALMGNVQILE